MILKALYKLFQFPCIVNTCKVNKAIRASKKANALLYGTALNIIETIKNGKIKAEY